VKEFQVEEKSTGKGLSLEKNILCPEKDPTTF
jgi:hypothetical protein